MSATTPRGNEYVTQVVQDRTAEQETLDSLLRVLVGGGVLALVLASMLGAALRHACPGAHPGVAPRPA